MKQSNFLRGTALALVAVFSIGVAQAAHIPGSLNFGGEATGDLGTATSLSFPTGLVVTNSTGVLAVIGFGDTGSIADFTFNPSGPVNALITVGGFSFALASVQIDDQQDMFLALSGTGTMSADGFVDTPYNFSMSLDSSGGGVAFSGTLASVPIPGALLLFMSGLAALGVRRRN